ncbi:MAG: hypothetical protein NVSMB2_01800 [Chloroflexota bacterium]
MLWVGVLVFLAWAARLAVLEGYIYEIDKEFLGDFTRTATLGAPTWWTGQGIFYGPIFVLEYRYLFETGLASGQAFAQLDFLLLGIAFGSLWLAFFGWRHLRLACVALACWLANHATIEALANTAHLEVLELTLICVAILLVAKQREGVAGAALGLAIATKTLPGLFVPYLALTRRWSLLVWALVVAGAVFLLVCWVQGLSPIQGLVALVYQGGNLTKLEYSEYEYTPRAEIARMLAAPDGSLTPEQARLALTGHWVIAIVTVAAVAALAVWKTRAVHMRFGLFAGLVAATMLVVAPSAHPPYYIFLLPAWTAIFAALVGRRLSSRTALLWIGLTLAYVFSGFDQPFFAAQRVIGFGAVVPEHWLDWHLPSLGLLSTLVLSGLLLAERGLVENRGPVPVTEANSEVSSRFATDVTPLPSR